ncbi:hypothetical protein CBOM_03484 [Ceraceosorus bombacis]|uniref:Uncharacterized protein n=1 Tax=Ceraceosorus bombacis TaxID=401625 RepID=A0A0P1BLD9_9BASI|nr:hypothetical protein CBOM_03484 [Ceraceosorus bombacis]
MLNYLHDALSPSKATSGSIGDNEVGNKGAGRVMYSGSLQSEDLPLSCQDDLEDIVLMLQRLTLQDADWLDKTEDNSMDVDKRMVLKAVDIPMEVDNPDCAVLEAADVNMDMMPAKTTTTNFWRCRAIRS